MSPRAPAFVVPGRSPAVGFGLASTSEEEYNSAMRLFTLHELAAVLGLNHGTLLRWRELGIIETATRPHRGRGRATWLTRDMAREVFALALARRGGAPMQQLAVIARRLRRERKHGRAFYSLGANRRAALLDGFGPGAPLHDPRTRQTVLFAAVDLRDLAPVIEAELDRLEREASA